MGTIEPGTTSGPIAYTSTPKYRALSFSASAGDVMDAWVRSIDGDAIAWITNAQFKSIATNDDAAGTTHDAHVLAKIETTGLYYLVFRERDFEPATFRASLARASEAGPAPGTPCTTKDELVKTACGFCGQKAAVCAQTSSGALQWSEYSPCEGEHGVCAPGSVRDAECGNCGHQSVTCTAQCLWTSTAACSGPVSACAPLTVDLTSAGCADPFQYRQRSCNDTCGYSSFGACVAPPTTIEVGRTVGTLSSTIAILDGSLPPLSMDRCPSAILNYPGSTFAYTKVHNSNATPVTVSIFHSMAPGGTIFETALAVYAGPEVPSTAAERIECLRTSEYGNAALTGDVRFSSIDAPSRRVTIPAGATFVVYSRPEVNTPATSQKLAVKLTVKTEAIGN